MKCEKLFFIFNLDCFHSNSIYSMTAACDLTRDRTTFDTENRDQTAEIYLGRWPTTIPVLVSTVSVYTSFRLLSHVDKPKLFSHLWCPKLFEDMISS